MSTTKLDLVIDQGTDWSTSLDFNNDDGTPVNLTGYLFSSVIKTSYFSNVNVSNFIVTVLNAPVGNAVMSMNAATSSNLSAGNYVYNVNMLDNAGLITNILNGVLVIRPSTLIVPPNNGAPSNIIG
jgi:hypothetical protein